MRNKSFFWFLTILVAIVSLYQFAFTFVGGNIETEAETIALERVEELKMKSGDENTVLPNGSTVNFTKDITINGKLVKSIEAEDIAKSAFVNEILKEKNDENVFCKERYKKML